MKRNIIICLALSATIALLPGCKGKTNAGENTAADPTSTVTATATADSTSAVLVRTKAAVAEDVENIVEFTSNIQAYKENNIAPTLPVRIGEILVEVGDYVRKGQVLVKMDPSQFNQTNILLANLEADYARLKAVYDVGGISRSEIDQAETQLKVQHDLLANLKENIELLSPIDGVVTARNYDPGDLYAGQPILQIMQINKLKVQVAVSEQYFPYVKLNMNSDIRVDMYPDEVFSGNVSLIYPSIDPNTRTFQVEITIPNPSNKLRPGMFSRTDLNFGATKGIMVEDLAVQRVPGSNDKYVFVAKDGKAERRTVTTGRQIGDRIELLTGVASEEEVIVAGISRLNNGTSIEVKND